MVTGKDPVHFLGAQVLACVGTHGIADGVHGHGAYVLDPRAEE